MNKGSKKSYLVISVALIALIATISALFIDNSLTIPTILGIQDNVVDVLDTEPKTAEISILAVGDNLLHDNIIAQASTDSGYDFTSKYENIDKYLEGHDINFINQETIIANDLFEPSGYPYFNSPTAAGDHLVDIGFNAIGLANNHTLDKGITGVLASNEYWSTKEGVVAFGTYDDEDDFYDIRTMEIDGVTFAFVAYTFSTNGITRPDSAPYSVTYTTEYERMQSQMEAADAVSDFIIVSVHWGTENSFTVNSDQTYLAQFFADNGADLILGTHPHVLQSIEYVESADGKEVLVAYSLGNFISSQHIANNLVSGMLDLTYTFDLETMEYTLDYANVIPIVTHYETSACNNVTIYSYEDYTEELAASHGVLNYDSSWSYDLIEQIVRANISEEFYN